jgi:hypothetical protein
MGQENSRQATSGEVAAPAYDAKGRAIKPFGQTQAAADHQLPRFRLSELEGNTIVIHSVEDFAGKFGPGFRVVITVGDSGERGVLLGHWTVIGKYLTRLQEDGDLPVSARVIKAQGKRYFDFEDPFQPQTSIEDAEKAETPF